MCGCLSSSPDQGPGLQPRHVSWLGIEPAIFGFTGWYSTHWATPAGAQFLILMPLHSRQSCLVIWPQGRCLGWQRVAVRRGLLLPRQTPVYTVDVFSQVDRQKDTSFTERLETILAKAGDTQVLRQACVQSVWLYFPLPISTSEHTSVTRESANPTPSKCQIALGATSGLKGHPEPHPARSQGCATLCHLGSGVWFRPPFLNLPGELTVVSIPAEAENPGSSPGSAGLSFTWSQTRDLTFSVCWLGQPHRSHKNYPPTLGGRQLCEDEMRLWL